VNRLAVSDVVVQFPDPDVDVEDDALMRVEAARLWRLVAGLPMAQRRVIVSRYGLGCAPETVSEIAARVGLPRTRVWRMEQEALEDLRAAYGVE
jgi:DNA-directed RNA polymerase sigma subunit (sigma70/sigma32)